MSGVPPGHYCQNRTLSHGARHIPVKNSWTQESRLPLLSLSSPSSSSISLYVLMDLVSPMEHLCYVRCTYCNTVLAVGVPSKPMMDTVTVRCGHCNHVSFLSPRPMEQSHSPTNHQLGLQGGCMDCLRSQPSPSSSSSSSSSNSNEPTIQKPSFVVKPPEKKHRMPSAYNRFMREEIQRIKASKPDIPHREAFSMASKNWAKCDPRCSIIDDKLTPVPQVERSCSTMENTNFNEQTEQKD
ncbi:protein DROOPING LEAF-like [Musa acuminata AAA Group]|uniref:protein DROOPING LEAF-like n=1 Tax=Musa acuminata AAA Group TaxID=214697 RepID=UPI0031DF72DC